MWLGLLRRSQRNLDRGMVYDGCATAFCEGVAMASRQEILEAIRNPPKLPPDVEYYETHYEELLEKYPNQWIAISDARLAGVADSSTELIAKMRDAGVPTNRMFMYHMETEPTIWILPTL